MAESMYGISREELLLDGLPAIDVEKQLNAFLTVFDVVLYSDAHRWDGDWVDTLYYATKVEKPYYVGSIYDLIGNDKTGQFDKHFARLAESGKYRHHRTVDDVQMIFEACCQVMG